MKAKNQKSSQHFITKAKSVSSYSRQKWLVTTSSSIQASKFNHQFINNVPPYVSPNKIASTNTITQYLKIKNAQKQTLPKKMQNRYFQVKNICSQKTTKNCVIPSYKQNQINLQKKLYSTKKIVLNMENNGTNSKNAQKKDTKKIQIVNPQINTIKNFSQSISTNTSGKNSNESLILDDFIFVRQIGTGKYGQVLMARHKKSGTIYALKRISKKNISQEIENQLIYQIKIQALLDHPNVIKLYGFFSDNEYIYLIMELCTSGDLYDLLKVKNSVTYKSSKIIIKQLCQGLDYLHHNKIIHRDLKLQNILYNFGMIKICDFGWSTKSESLRQTFCGTPIYISPQLLQRKNYDNKVDIWSIGILAYQLIFGKVPFQIKTQQDLCKIVEDELEFPQYPVISTQGQEFLKGCLSKNPLQRLQIAQLINHKFLSNCQIKGSLDLY